MFRYTSYEKTILIAVIIILLCLASVVGVTLALFTNNVEEGTIGINVTMGKLKVDIVDEDNESLVGKTLRFENTDPDGILFEPGAKVYTQEFRVSNEGDIPMNYHVYISDAAITKKQEFVDAFDFYITTNPHDPNPDVQLKDFMGELKEKTTSVPYYLVIKMKEDANNDYRNLTFGSIGITVYAVQGGGNIE